MGVDGLAIPGIFREGGIEKVKQEISELESKRQELYGDIDIDRKINEAKDQLKGLKADIVNAQYEYRVLVNKRAVDIENDAKKQTEAIREEIKKARKELDDAIDYKNKLKAEAEALKVSMERNNRSIDAAMDEFKEEVERTKRLLDEREALIAQSEANIYEKESKINEKIIENGNILSLIRAEKDESLATIKEAQELSLLADKKMELAEIECKKITKELYDEKNKVDDYARERKKELDSREAQINKREIEIKNSLEAIEVEKGALAAKTREYEQNIKDLNTNWKRFEEDTKNLERRIKKVNRREDDLKEREARAKHG